MQDYEKGLHYVDKMLDVWEIYDDNRIATYERTEVEVDKYAQANGLNRYERDFIFLMCGYANKDDVQEAKDLLLGMIIALQAEQLEKQRGEPTWPGTPEDGGHHSRQQPD